MKQARFFRVTTKIGNRTTLSSDDTFTLQQHGTRSGGQQGQRFETTPYDLASFFSRCTLKRLLRNPRIDGNDREKIEAALEILRGPKYAAAAAHLCDFRRKNRGEQKITT